ncbi:MAG TPA: cytochrome P450 [Solirubrobacteraceae bacterium]|nr:cytochrome P450 [Solirubrobacteraceae bacterium]
MPLVTEMELPELDYMDPDLRGSAYHEAVAALRERGWIARTPLAYLVLEREAASFFLRTKSATFPGKQIAELFDISEGPLHEEIERNILHIDGADHRRLRNLVNPAFTPRAADRWRPVMRGFLDELWAAVPASGECDFVAAFAKPYPSLTIAAVMGAPREDAPRLAEWSNWIQRQFDGPTLLAERHRVEQACAEFYEWAGEMLRVRRATPGDDLVSTLIAEEQDGDRLSDVELVNLVLNVLVGGVDTTQSQLAHAVRLFAEHPDQWDLVRADPEAHVPRAVEEALRYEPITPFTARIMREDVEYGGVTFPEGTIVLVATVTANRDGVEDADRFDVTREPTKPLTFGAGIHYCLGANLAKAELQEALTFLAARVERFELTSEPDFDTVQGVYGMASLPLRLVLA